MLKKESLRQIIIKLLLLIKLRGIKASIIKWNTANNLNYQKDTTSYVPVVTLSARDNKKLSKCPSKAFERSVYWNEYKTKSESKNTTNGYKSSIKSNYIGIKRLFVLAYLDRDNDRKMYKAVGIIYQKVLSRITSPLSMERTFMTNLLILI